MWTGRKNLRAGERVALEPGVACNNCQKCRSGRYNLCPDTKFAATPPYNGTLATYYVLPEECCHLLPSQVSLREGALVEPLSVAVHCCRLAGTRRARALPFLALVRLDCSAALSPGHLAPPAWWLSISQKTAWPLRGAPVPRTHSGCHPRAPSQMR